MKVHIRELAGPRQPWEGTQFVAELVRQFEFAGDSRYQQVDSPQSADLILLTESNLFKGRDYLRVLDEEPVLQAWPEKCFTINYDDDALGLLPGIYAGLPRKRFEQARHRAGCYIHPVNPVTAEKALERCEVKPTQLISFRGAMSHPIRRKILTHEHLRSLGPITHIDRWFNHTEEEKNAYLDEVLASKFVLCPRGISPSSIRLFEVMELGRVPVILADEWVPPDGPPWSRFSIRIAESRLDELPRIIRCQEQQWKEMAARSR